MILLSSIINQFEDRFLVKYKKTVLPSHRKALHVMKQCRKEHGPHMLVPCTNDACGQQAWQRFSGQSFSKQLLTGTFLIPKKYGSSL